MNNNFTDVGLNWFQTWPIREQTSLKQTLKITRPNNVYNKYLKNITSLDAITSPNPTKDVGYLSSTLKSKDIYQADLNKKDKINMNIDLINRNHEPLKNMTMDCALESLPLVYNPSTKRLQFVKVKNISLNPGQCKLPLYFSEGSNQIEGNHRDSEEVVCLLNNSVPAINKDSYQSSQLVLNNFHCNPDDISPTHSSYHDMGSMESLSNTIHQASIHTSVSYSGTNGSLPISTADSLQPEDSISQSEINCIRKKKGLTNVFNRNLFTWNQKDDKISENNNCDNDSISLSSTTSISSTTEGSSLYAWKRFSKGFSGKVNELEAGSAGLIMQGRPKDLPAKAAGEEERHKQEYETIVSAAKKKDLKDAKDKRKAQAALLKQEKQLSEAVRTWNTIIMPKWETMHTQKKCQDLWWAGIPSCVRGRVWKLAIGNDLHLTSNLYSILVNRSLEKLVTLSLKGSMGNLLDEDNGIEVSDHESTIDLIRLDVSRTFPHLCIFQKGGPFHDPLHNILGAYVCYRPDVGYVQGMSFLAATLLLNMDESEAFISFTNLLNRPAHMAFFCIDQPKMQTYYSTFEKILKENLPQLFEHLAKLKVSPDMYFLDWVLTVFARSLPLDVSARVWDVYLRDGEEFLIRAAIGILKYYEKSLLAQECTAMTAQFLTRLPDDLDADLLFKAINGIQTTANKNTFKSILEFYTRGIAVEPL